MLLSEYELFNGDLNTLPDRKLLITTLNAHSYNMSGEDDKFAGSLAKSDVLIPDGVSVVWAVRWLTGKKLHKIAGADLFFHEMKRLNASKGSCFFLGSSEKTLKMITDRAAGEYPDVRLESYSPPYKPEFTKDENDKMIHEVNSFRPDVLFVGMTAPKQEKWAYEHLGALDCGHICCIGAVFDFYAGTVNRAPGWMISLGLEWLYRLVKEPSRMWRRYLIGNTKFVWQVIREKFTAVRI
jgi:N-acetylglucosaminyldiphosphoundecaprenol N-acetyl-beta-D-mannosaminyltransferase